MTPIAIDPAPARIDPPPPADWVRAHDLALRVTVLARQASLPLLIRNRPVPRLADHHYFALDRDRNNRYFY